MDWWKDVSYKDKERKKEERHEMKKDLDKWNDVSAAKAKRKRKERTHQNEIEREYEKLSVKHQQIKLRIQRSGK